MIRRDLVLVTRGITSPGSWDEPPAFLQSKFQQLISPWKEIGVVRPAPDWSPRNTLLGVPIWEWQWSIAWATPGLISTIIREDWKREQTGADIYSGQAPSLLGSISYNFWGPLLSCSCIEGLPSRMQCLGPCSCVTQLDKENMSKYKLWVDKNLKSTGSEGPRMT